jgi:hypothetical protein
VDTALIIVIAVVAAVVLFLIARSAWARSLEARREKAGELRDESTREEERARRAEVEAERKRGTAEVTRRRADRLDPDAETPGRRFSFLRRDEDEVADEDEAETEGRGERRGLWDRLVHR